VTAPGKRITLRLGWKKRYCQLTLSLADLPLADHRASAASGSLVPHPSVRRFGIGQVPRPTPPPRTIGGERPYSLDIKLARNPGHENPFARNLVPAAGFSTAAARCKCFRLRRGRNTLRLPGAATGEGDRLDSDV
jgi:hypothetical protein